METPEYNKVEAIYRLREAVEAKAAIEHIDADHRSPTGRDQLLAAQLDVESKTQDAIDACQECGCTHTDDVSHGVAARITAQHDNVVHVNFGPAAESA